MSKKVVVIFIEGYTEKEFYKELVEIMRMHCGGKFDCSIEIENAKGIGQYKRKVLGTFDKRIKPKNPDAQFFVALCHDQDVFELEKNPPVNWDSVKKAFCERGVKEICEIKAEKAIEDWFLYDVEGILKYLRLPQDTKIPKGSGADKLKELFKKANKLYVKGERSAGLVQALNMELILSNICPDVSPLCRLLGVECGEQKKCKHT